MAKKVTKASSTKRVAAKVNPKKVTGSLAGFMEFVRTQGVVGLAVGLAIGTQASELVKSIVSNIITPMVDLLVGKEGLAGLSWTVNVVGRTATFEFGVLIDAILRFIAIALVIYYVVKGLKLDKLDKKKD